ncbi:flavin-containing monooxygenase [Pseudomonas borbori]
MSGSESTAPLRVVIIGSGFAGVGLAIRLKQAGIEDFLLLEKAAEVGGTWRDNDYPGAACDVPSHLYSFSFAPKADWSRKYAPQAEIQQYLLDCVERYALRRHIACNREVVAARFDAPAALWRIKLANGEELSAQVLVSACGQLNRPAYPPLAGIEHFAGEAFHSARWRHDLDLSGKRVAVIGTGASAIQFVPQIQPKVANLQLFQRSPAYVLPKPDRAYRRWEVALKRRWPWLQRIDRGLKYLQHELRALAFINFPGLMGLFRSGFIRHLADHIADPELRTRLEPDYPMGCKRILISNDYYPALAQANVQVVSEAIREVNAGGIVTADGHQHACDVLIFATGFAASEFLAPMQITGLDGVELNQRWKEGAEAYKGISVSGFPNLFLLYGPNTNLGHSSIIYMLESQFRYVLSCIETLRERALRYLDVKPQAQLRFNRQVQTAVQRTIWAQGCDSWYRNDSGKHTNNWPGYTFSYRHITRAPELADYECTR